MHLVWIKICHIPQTNIVQEVEHLWPKPRLDALKFRLAPHVQIFPYLLQLNVLIGVVYIEQPGLKVAIVGCYIAGPEKFGAIVEDSQILDVKINFLFVEMPLRPGLNG